MECKTAQPATAVTWLKGTKMLSNCEKYQIRQEKCTLILTILNLEKGDTDAYSCIVETSKSIARLTVQGKSE